MKTLISVGMSVCVVLR